MGEDNKFFVVEGANRRVSPTSRQVTQQKYAKAERYILTNLCAQNVWFHENFMLRLYGFIKSFV